MARVSHPLDGVAGCSCSQVAFLRHAVAILLLFSLVALLPLASANPPDHTWLAGLYDVGDGDDVASLVDAMELLNRAEALCVVGRHWEFGHALTNRGLVPLLCGPTTRPISTSAAASRGPPLGPLDDSFSSCPFSFFGTGGVAVPTSSFPSPQAFNSTLTCRHPGQRLRPARRLSPHAAAPVAPSCAEP